MPVIDVTTFRLAPTSDEAAFLEADERVRTGVLYHRPGIVRATTARADDGEWAVIVIWGSDEEADDTALDELLALADPASVERKRFTTFD